MSSRRQHLGVHGWGALALAGWVVLTAASHHSERLLPVFLGTMTWQWFVFLAVWRRVAKSESNQLLRPILAWAAAFLVCGLFARLVLEDDHFRFLWDGWQFATTGNPYAAAPSAFFGRADLPERFQPILDQINYPHVPTIYAPVCQFAFALSYGMAPGQLWPWKLMLFFIELALLSVVIAIARGTSGQPDETDPAWPRRVVHAALIAGWCPLTVFETGFNAHPDALGILWISAAWLLRLRGLEMACGICCGLAGASKIFALLLVPFLLGRSRKGWVGFAAAFACAYAPFWLQGSAADLAGLSTLASEWEFNSSLYALVRLSLGAPMAKLICAALFFTAWLLLFRRAMTQGKSRLFQSTSLPGLEIFGTLFLVSATVNPWYLLWLAPFAAVRPSATTIAALALVGLSYITGLNLGEAGLGNFEHPGWVRLIEYGGVALVCAVEWWRLRAKK